MTTDSTEVHEPSDADIDDMRIHMTLHDLRGLVDMNLSIQDVNIIISALEPIHMALTSKITVSGNVSDESGSLVGVNILVKGKIAGTISDRDGNFSLDVADTPATLVFSIVGYESQEVEVSSNVSDLNITLSESILIGSEVVVSASKALKIKVLRLLTSMCRKP